MSPLIDFTGVEEHKGFEAIPPGNYVVVCDDAVVKGTKSGTGEYVKVTLRITEGQFTGRKLFHNFNIKNENQKAVQIGLSQLKTFMKIGGLDASSLEDVLDLVTIKPVVAHVKHREYMGKAQEEVSYFKAKEESADAKGDSFL